MRPKQLLIWLPLAGLAACSPELAVVSLQLHCQSGPRACADEVIMFQLAALGLGLFMLVVISRALYIGAGQAVRTHRALRTVLTLPHCPLPSTLVPIADDLNIRQRIDIVDSPAPGAFCYGFVRPRICLTSTLLAALTPSETEAVLRHEQHHLRQRDPLRALAWSALTGMCGWLAERHEHARLQRELAADRAVIRAGGRYSLASALLRLLSMQDSRSDSGSELAISGISVTGARIDQLLRPEPVVPRRPSLIPWLIFPLVVALTLLLCRL